MNYRILAPEEWLRLLPLFEGHAEALPLPEFATAAIAEDDDGEIQGMLMLQLQFHMEPLVIRNPRVSFERLHRTLHDALAERKGLVYYAFIPDSKIRRMVEHLGMTAEPWEVWKGEI
jgi:hypothetical protein